MAVPAVVELPYPSSPSSPYPNPYQSHYYNEFHEGDSKVPNLTWKNTD